jgi:hypothetical protein
MKAVRLFPTLVIVIGIIFALGGLTTMGAGIYINNFVVDELAAQNITTPEDATIPNAPVTSIATALSMADIIQHHAADSSKGLTYAQMGRFAVESGDPAGTNNADEALKGENGKPVANAARNTQLTAAGLVTSLSLSRPDHPDRCPTVWPPSRGGLAPSRPGRLAPARAAPAVVFNAG